MKRNRVVIVALVIILGIVAAAYVSGLKLPNLQNSSSATGLASSAIAKDKLPGTEEFGLSKRELVEKIEAVEALIAKCMSGHDHNSMPFPLE